MTRTPVSPSLGFLVWHLSLRWQAQLSRALQPVGLTHAEYGLLASLYGLTSVSGLAASQRELADFSGLEPMYVSKLVRSLEEAGLVERTRSAADPRAIQCSLTDSGIDTVKRARKIVVQLEERRLRALGGTDSRRSAELRRALETLLAQAREEDRGSPEE